MIVGLVLQSREKGGVGLMYSPECSLQRAQLLNPKPLAVSFWTLASGCKEFGCTVSGLREGVFFYGLC